MAFRPKLAALGIIALACAGLAVLWFADSLMLFTLHLVGEESALGAENVVRTDGGGVLLTNPGMMGLWTAPFLGFGAGLIALAAGFAYAWHRRLDAVRSHER